MKFVIDTSSCIDYFDANDSGKNVKEYIEDSNNEVILNVLNLAEIASFFARKGIDMAEVYKVIISNFKIYYFDAEFSKNTGFLHAEIKKDIKDFSLADAFVLFTARKLNAKILTGDKHFKGFKEAILI